MHTSLAVAFTYDRYMHGTIHSGRTLEECFHWHRGTALLSERLQKPIKPQDKDAIWGTSAALAIMTVSSPDARSPDQAWPLRRQCSADFEWLGMINGKMSLWSVFDPLRPDSIFRTLTTTYAQMSSPLPERGTNGIPAALASLGKLHHDSTPESNPYFLATHAVSQLLLIPDHEVSLGQIPVFTRTIRGSFEILLKGKDPAALLLLYLWYCKASRGTWWIELRARVECPAIRLYLQSYHKDDAVIHAILARADSNNDWIHSGLGPV